MQPPTYSLTLFGLIDTEMQILTKLYTWTSDAGRGEEILKEPQRKGISLSQRVQIK
jgi:hypothetical protein